MDFLSVCKEVFAQVSEIVIESVIEVAFETVFENTLGKLFKTSTEVSDGNGHDLNSGSPYIRNSDSFNGPSYSNPYMVEAGNRSPYVVIAENGSDLNFDRFISLDGSFDGDSYSDPFEDVDPFKTPETTHPYMLSTSWNYTGDSEKQKLQDAFDLVEKDLAAMREIKELKDLIELADIDLDEETEL